MKVTLYEFCLLHHQEELLEQWDPANLPATPQNVTYGTRDEYWWQCEKGHRWQAPVKSRTSGRGCPYCSTRRLQPGVNDFATRFPDIAAQWHPTKNGAFQPGPGGPRLPPEGLVALRGGARVAGQRDQPHQRRVGVPRVRRAAGPAGGE